MAALYGVKAEGGGEADLAAKVAAALVAAQEVAGALSKLLDRSFQGRESMYMGDYWLAEGTTKIRVVAQPDYRMDEILEEKFEDYQVLIYVDGPSVSGINGLATPHGIVEVLEES